MQLEQELYAVVFPDGKILNCWTSPNRLYEDKGAATRILNQHIREAEELLLKGPTGTLGIKESKAQIARMAPARQEILDQLKSAKVKKVVIRVC